MNQKKSHLALEYFLENDVHLACLSETWFFNINNYQTALFAEGGNYIAYNRPRVTKTIGGGVCIFVKDKYKCTQQKKNQHSSFESISILCSISNLPSQKLKVVSIYRKEAVKFSIFLNEFTKFVQDMVLSKYPFVIAGDFNIQMNNADHSYTKRFTKFCQTHNLNLSNVPSSKTHVAGNTIVFLLSDSIASSLITECSVDYDAPGGISHHYPVAYTFKTTLQCRQLAVSRAKHSFINFIIDDFKIDLSKSLKDMQFCSTFESKLNTFQEHLHTCYNNHAPLHVTNISYNERPKWMDHEYIEQRAIRRKLERIFKRTNYSQDEINFKLQRTKCALMVSTKRDGLYTASFKAFKGDIKAQFAMFERLVGKSPKHSVQNMPDIDAYGNSFNLASSFNNYFMDKVSNIQKHIQSEQQLQQSSNQNCLTCLPNNANNINDHGTVQYLTSFKLCDHDELKEIVISSAIKTTFLIDPLPSDLMSQCLDALMPHLLDLVNTSLLTGSIDGVKFSFVRPLLKQFDLDVSEFSSYRPISNLSFISKLVERVVAKRLNEHMTINNLHVDSQHGYKTGHSTETLLIKFINDLLVAVDQNRGVVVLLIDLSSAFDTVQHSILLKILKSMYIDGTALNWFQSFLCGRSQAVVIDDVFSEWLTVTCGVPQGSVLGPILFNIYCRHIDTVFEQCGFVSSSYADDNSGIKSFALFNQLDTLYNDVPNCLEKLKHYMIQSHLKLNDNKTEILVFGSSKFKDQVLLHGTFLKSGECIRFCDKAKYLGVLFDTMLTFEDQIQKVTSMSYTSMRNISSIKSCLSKSNLETFVHAFISSHLDYCNIIYIGLPRKLLSKLQKLQNAAIRLIFKVRARHPVSSLYFKLHWLNIDQRITFKALLFVYKCVNGLAPNVLKALVKIRNSESLTLQTTYFPKTKFGRRAFVYYAPKYWNAIPVNIRCIRDINIFKTSLKSYLLLHYTEFKDKIS